MLLLIGIIVACAVVGALAWRHGWPSSVYPGRPPYPPADLVDDHEPRGFTTEFGPKRERPPSEADGPGWDS